MMNGSMKVQFFIDNEPVGKPVCLSFIPRVGEYISLPGHSLAIVGSVIYELKDGEFTVEIHLNT